MSRFCTFTDVILVHTPTRQQDRCHFTDGCWRLVMQLGAGASGEVDEEARAVLDTLRQASAGSRPPPAGPGPRRDLSDIEIASHIDE